MEKEEKIIVDSFTLFSDAVKNGEIKAEQEEEDDERRNSTD